MRLLNMTTAAYFKMQNALVDDRRIWVDFSQSVAWVVERDQACAKAWLWQTGWSAKNTSIQGWERGDEYGMVFDV